MFPLSYRDDPGLEFLRFCSHGDLKDLADILTTEKGSERGSAQLRSDRRYRQNINDLTKAWKMVAAELQRFGADSVVSVFRLGEGVVYREILGDVCDHLKVKCRKGEDLPRIESRVLLKVLEASLEKMTEEERAAFVKSAADLFTDGKFNPANATAAAILAALQAGIAMGGFAAFQIAAIAANAVSNFVLGRGLAFAANAGLMRILGLVAGPIGWVISGILSVPMISGAAYRVTVPAVIYVAYLRQKHLTREPL